VNRKGVGANQRPLSPIPVRIDGYRIDGQLEDGDLVEFTSAPIVAEVNSVARIRNLSKNLDLVSYPIEESPESKKYFLGIIVERIFWGIIVGLLAFLFFSAL
jgi:hypothetical protein